MPDGLLHVISGILAGGIPGFRIVLLLLRSPSGMALCVEKAPCTDLRSDPTLLPKFLQNYAGGRVRQPRTPNTSAARKSLT